jgi:hypothetical protein
VSSRRYAKSYLKGVTEWLEEGFICQEAVQYRTRTSKKRVQRLRYCGRQDTSGEGITRNNSGARIQDRDESF